MKLFDAFNKLIARLRGSVGWCAMAYVYNRNYLSQNPIGAWWGAFTFKFKKLKHDAEHPYKPMFGRLSR